ncbi:MAG: hypothetical protein D6828_00215 [Nitrospirae bacterium]|nr:MAG: hypothetical protein D6828_00215 [Nitrospirota bacterium]
MHQFHKYIDLRQNKESPFSGISFWPTFTDIMTVILMIFMLAMVVTIIKNSNLLEQLSGVKSKVVVLEEKLKESQAEENELKMNIADLEEELRSKEMEIILLKDEKEVIKSTLEAKLALISALQSDIERMKREKEASEEKLKTLTAEMEKKIEEFNKKFKILTNLLSEKEKKIVVLSAKSKELELALARQRREYTLLEEEYNKLVGPARSPIGKDVVTVIYSKIGEAYRILFKDVNSNKTEALTLNQLHNRLRSLKEKLGDRLYVKIVIPENSGLTYNEAWNFTKDILTKYDYYYQNRKRIYPTLNPPQGSNESRIRPSEGLH